MRNSDQPVQVRSPQSQHVVAALGAILALSTALTTVVPTPAEAKRGGYTRVLRQPADKSPLTIVVSLRQQRLQVFDSRGLVAKSPISSGRPGYGTPTGIFSIIQKNREHYSNLYDDAAMPNMQRITWSGVALHAGDLPGYPASHGCIRLPYGFSNKLFAMTSLGTRVIVHDDMVEPRNFSHPRLFTALPPGPLDVPPQVPSEMRPMKEGSSTSLGSVSAMLGVTPAVAAEAAMKIAAHPADNATTLGAAAPQDSGRTRAIALAERQAIVDERAAKVRELETAHGAAADSIADVNGRLNAARQELKAAREAEPLLKRDVTVKKRAVATAERNMRNFIQRQTRELTRMADREERRRQEHLADGSSDLSPEELLKRAEVRNTEQARDNNAHEAAGAEETRLEADHLDAIHAVERAESAIVEQADLIGQRTGAVRAIELDLAGAKKHYGLARKALDNAIADHRAAVEVVKQFEKPATVFVSRSTGKMHIRQGFAEVYSAPATIAFPNAKIGTHVFTATRYADGTETRLEWQAMSLTDSTPDRAQRTRRDEAQQTTQRMPPPNAANALERIDLPAEARMRITELMKPGSTLIISDAAESPETGLQTDIIVQPPL